MNRFAYTAAITLLSPALLAWMGLRARRAGGQWGVLSGPRFGRYAKAAPKQAPVWIHAVSLGETRAAQPLAQALLDAGHTVLLTHMTATGRAEASRMFAEAIEQGHLLQEWLPYDFPGSVQRFLTHYKPKLGVMIEREIWPNIIAAARRLNIPMVLASARFSDNALRQNLRAGRVMREAYESLAAVYAQTLQDAQRLEQAGAVAVRVSGNFKFDVTPPPQEVARGKAFAAALPRKMLTIASTREGEDEMFINALSQQLKRAAALGNGLTDEVLFCLIPRHPQRFDEAAALLAKAGISYVRRSQFANGDGTASSNIKACADATVLLGDSIGEMPRYYAASQVAIVAGSFAPLGGQNLIEACAVGLPVIVGPHTRNFQQAAADAVHEGAALRAPDADNALQLALQLLDDPQRLARMGEAGAYWVKQHAGAVERVMNGLQELLQPPSGMR